MRSAAISGPKLDHYPNHQFLVCHAVVDRSRVASTTVEVDAFIHDRWLVTVRKDEGFALEPVLERWDRSTDLAAHGVGFLVYGLLDIVDRPGASPRSTSSTSSTTT